MDIHSTAIIHPDAVIHAHAIVGPYCIVEKGAILDAGVRLVAHVYVDAFTHLKENVQVYPFSSLGTPPQHWGYNQEETSLTIGRDTQIREHVTVHRGTVQGGGKTSIGESCMVMVGCHVGHDGHIGNRVTMANNVVLGGHVEIEDDVVFGGMVVVHQMASVGRGAMIAGGSALGGHVMPYTIAIGNRATLAGLNLHRLKKQNVPSEAIHALRALYQYLFVNNGHTSIDFRLYNPPQDLTCYSVVQEALEFLKTRNKTRPLCLPQKEPKTQALTRAEL